MISRNCLPARVTVGFETRPAEDLGVKNLLKRFGVTGGGFLSLPVGLNIFWSSWTGGVIPRLDIIVRYSRNNGIRVQWRDGCKRKQNARRMAGLILKSFDPSRALQVQHARRDVPALRKRKTGRDVMRNFNL